MKITNKSVYTDREIIEETGQEDEVKARQSIRFLARVFEEQKKAQTEYFMERLDSRKKYNDYIPILKEILENYILEENLENNVRWAVDVDNIGIVLHVIKDARIYQRAFRASRKPLYDLNACKRYAAGISDLSAYADLIHGRAT